MEIKSTWGRGHNPLENKRKDRWPEIKKSLSHKLLNCKYYLPASVEFAGDVWQFRQAGIPIGPNA
jgi:hypothetical protein